MALVKISAEDFKKGQPLDAGIYAAELKKFEIASNRANDGINYICDFHIDDKTLQGRMMRHYFSSKMLWRIIPFLELCTDRKFDIDDAKNNGFEFDTDWIEEAVGLQLAVEISYNPTAASYKNNIVAFLPVEAVTHADWPFDSPRNNSDE